MIKIVRRLFVELRPWLRLKSDRLVDTSRILFVVPVINPKETSSFDCRRENRRLSTDSRSADAASVVITVNPGRQIVRMNIRLMLERNNLVWYSKMWDRTLSPRFIANLFASGAFTPNRSPIDVLQTIDRGCLCVVITWSYSRWSSDYSVRLRTTRRQAESASLSLRDVIAQVQRYVHSVLTIREKT